MNFHTHLPHANNLDLSRNSSRKTMQARSITPVKSAKVLSSSSVKQRYPIRVDCKKPSTPNNPQGGPYVLMRNGVTFLYTPGRSDRNFPNLISAFGTPLRGSKISGRFNAGNMFAIHTDDRVSPSFGQKPRSYLTMRSKWK